MRARIYRAVICIASSYCPQILPRPTAIRTGIPHDLAICGLLRASPGVRSAPIGQLNAPRCTAITPVTTAGSDVSEANFAGSQRLAQASLLHESTTNGLLTASCTLLNDRLARGVLVRFSLPGQNPPAVTKTHSRLGTSCNYYDNPVSLSGISRLEPSRALSEGAYGPLRYGRYLRYLRP